MTAMDIFQRIAVVQTSVVELPLVNIAATLETKRRNQSLHMHQHKENDGKHNCEKLT